MNATESPKPVPANTARTYAQRWAEFSAWCRRTGYSPCPATSDTLEAYTSTLCEANYAPASIDVAIAAIRAHHIEAGQHVPDATAARRITAVYRRGRVPRNARILTLDEIHAMLATCDTKALRGLRDAVVVALGTALMSNVSALCGLDLADITPFPHGLNIVVRGRERAAHVATVPHGTRQDTDPVTLTRRWIDILARHGIDDGPLLRSCGRGGRLETSGRLSPGALNLIVRRLAQHAGIADCQKSVPTRCAPPALPWLQRRAFPLRPSPNTAPGPRPRTPSRSTYTRPINRAISPCTTSASDRWPGTISSGRQLGR